MDEGLGKLFGDSSGTKALLVKVKNLEQESDTHTDKLNHLESENLSNTEAIVAIQRAFDNLRFRVDKIEREQSKRDSFSPEYGEYDSSPDDDDELDKLGDLGDIVGKFGEMMYSISNVGWTVVNALQTANDDVFDVIYAIYPPPEQNDGDVMQNFIHVTFHKDASHKVVAYLTHDLKNVEGSSWTGVNDHKHLEEDFQIWLFRQIDHIEGMDDDFY